MDYMFIEIIILDNDLCIRSGVFASDFYYAHIQSKHYYYSGLENDWDQCDGFIVGFQNDFTTDRNNYTKCPMGSTAEY